MKHEYTIEYHKCPNCGKVLKIFNPMSYLALLIITAVLPLLLFWEIQYYKKYLNMI